MRYVERGTVRVLLHAAFVVLALFAAGGSVAIVYAQHGDDPGFQINTSKWGW